MKKSIPVIKMRYATISISIALIVIGIICFIAFGGFNTGIDFASGLSEQVQVAPVGMSVSYSGLADTTFSVTNNTLVLTQRSENGVTNTTFDVGTYPTVADIVNGLAKIDGITAKAVNGSLSTSALVSGFGFPAELGQQPIKINFATPTSDVTIDSVRDALSSWGSVNVQTVGAQSDGIFQIKMSPREGDTQESMENDIAALLGAAYGIENVVVLQSDFVGPKFSSSLFTTSILAIIVAVALILVYIWIRFRFSYAISSIIALTHDVILMLAFIVVFRLEVSSTTIAAILTIIGYSLNNTIVIFDRVRENVRLFKGKDMDEIINQSVTQSLTRTIITSLTTLFAIVPLAVFGTGSIQLFALNLTWGILVGAYSSNFLAPAFLHWFNKVKPLDQEKVKKSVVDNEGTSV